jgi:hypothetical protein
LGGRFINGSGALRGEAVKLRLDVIARSEATKQSILSLRGTMDCFAPLAMTALQRRASTLSPRNGSDGRDKALFRQRPAGL